MTKPVTKGKTLQARIDLDLVGWLEWRGQQPGATQSDYVNRLLRADRDKTTESELHMYKLWLYSTGRDEELASIDPDFVALMESTNPKTRG